VDGGLIKAGSVIVATGTATAEFRPLRRHFKMREVYHALTEPMPAAIRKQVGDRSVTVKDPAGLGRRVVWTPDSRLLVLGGDQDETAERRRPDVLVQRTGQLMYEALTIPAIAGLRPEGLGGRPTARPPTGCRISGLTATTAASLRVRRHRRTRSPARFSRRAHARAGAPGRAGQGDQVFGWTDDPHGGPGGHPRPGPHPDDIEIGIGGTVAKHARLGHYAGLCDLTAGEMGSNGTVAERLAEAEARAAVLGAAWRTNLRLPDRAIGSSPSICARWPDWCGARGPAQWPCRIGPTVTPITCTQASCSPRRSSARGCGASTRAARRGSRAPSSTTSSTITRRRRSSWT
jgi:hypothetical protein